MTASTDRLQRACEMNIVTLVVLIEFPPQRRLESVAERKLKHQIGVNALGNVASLVTAYFCSFDSMVH